MNSITDQIRIGTVGELLVQIRLLQYDVQAAPPIKDSGNDLIAVKGREFRAIQVKTTADPHQIRIRNLPDMYHLLALVFLSGDGRNIALDHSGVYLLKHDEVERQSYSIEMLQGFILNEERVNYIFPQSDR